MGPSDGARRIRLEAIRRRVGDDRATSNASLDRRWLLDEIDRLQRELDDTNERLRAVAADYERDVTP